MKKKWRQVYEEGIEKRGFKLTLRAHNLEGGIPVYRPGSESVGLITLEARYVAPNGEPYIVPDLRAFNLSTFKSPWELIRASQALLKDTAGRLDTLNLDETVLEYDG